MPSLKTNRFFVLCIIVSSTVLSAKWNNEFKCLYKAFYEIRCTNSAAWHVGSKIFQMGWNGAAPNEKFRNVIALSITFRRWQENLLQFTTEINIAYNMFLRFFICLLFFKPTSYVSFNPYRELFLPVFRKLTPFCIISFVVNITEFSTENCNCSCVKIFCIFHLGLL